MECLCISRDQALTKANILSGFEASGIWSFCPEKVVDRHYATEEPTQPAPSTPFKVDSIREEALGFNMTPHSREKLQKSLGYLESKIKPRSQKQLQGPRTLGRAYVEEEKARIAAATAPAAKKAADREANRLAREQKAKEAKECRSNKKLKRGCSSCSGTWSLQGSSIKDCKALKI